MIRDEIVLEATIENLSEVVNFFNNILENTGCSVKVQREIEISVEEIYINIAKYAYQPETGEVKIRAEVTDDPAELTITFIDSGVHYDPLKKKDPDVTESLEKRKIGGLGIYLMKQSMDDASYMYTGGKNILIMKKSL